MRTFTAAMATSRTSEDRTTPVVAGGEQQEFSEGGGENQQSSKGKEKKKVGFASDRQLQPGNLASPSYLTPEDPRTAAHDYFSYTPSPYSNESTPVYPDEPAKRESFNSEAVAAALAQILNSQQGGTSAGPSKPRPVLRKSTTLPSSPDVPTAPLRSEVEAKYRADRLAYSVGTSSVPASTRASLDSQAETDAGFDRDALLDKSKTADSDVLEPRKKAQQEADKLVRRHTRRRSPLIQSSVTSESGTATPVDHDLEYVPRPQRYRGGILGTLLKLYSSENKHGSTYSDSSAPSSPSQTPVSTPPTSRSSTPRPDKRRRALRTHSSSTLTGLMESSFMFAAPGSSKDISEVFSEKVKQEAERPKKSSKSKKKLDEFRIKVHIADIINRHRYLLKLCKALMIFGAPTHRLEAFMRMSARVLGIEGQFMYLPDTMIISFDDSDTHTTEVKIVRAPQGLDFGRLRDVHEIYKEVVHDRMGVDEATQRLDEITARKPRLPVWLRILLYGLASVTVGPFGFEARYIDLPPCFILGCLVGFLQLCLAPSNELYANVFEITAAVATSFLARVFGSIRGGELFCFSALAQSSIALILPGYMVLCASLELQSHQLISGSVRMVYSLIYTLFLGYGFTIGSVIYGYMDRNAVSSVHCQVGDSWYTKRPPDSSYLLFVLPFTLCLCFINQARWKQIPVQAFISLAGYAVNYYSSRFFKNSTIVSSSLGALTIGVLANLYSRLGHHVQNWFLDVWERKFQPRLRRVRRKHRRRSPYEDYSAAAWDESVYPKEIDLETGLRSAESPPAVGRQRTRPVGYGLAAAAMLPAIFVQVPSGLAASGSLLSSVTSADQITGNQTQVADLNGTAFNVLGSVILVAISISVGLSLSALVVYPFGKRRSGLFSF
ncbi:hypothetical protein VTK56DRAFT_4672 [Thermocarpiscus australiensis]